MRADEPKRTAEFERFRALVKKLVAVPKKEITAKEKGRKKRPRTA